MYQKIPVALAAGSRLGLGSWLGLGVRLGLVHREAHFIVVVRVAKVVRDTADWPRCPAIAWGQGEGEFGLGLGQGEGVRVRDGMQP